jgi:hypothetical protein
MATARHDAILNEAAQLIGSFRPDSRDFKWIFGFTQVWLCTQVELDSHGRKYPTWWVRWVDSNTGLPIESVYCEHPILAVVAVADYLDKAGI